LGRRSSSSTTRSKERCARWQPLGDSVEPTEDFAASFAKIGACTTAFLFPILLVDLGTAKLLYILVGTSLLGAAITWLFRIETAGVNLEEIGTEGDRGSSTDPSLVFTPRS
jgi:hypothetical protein